MYMGWESLPEHNRGYARVYHNVDDNNIWETNSNLEKFGTSNNVHFGTGVAVSGDGARACIGAYGEMDAMWRSGLLLYLTAPYSNRHRGRHRWGGTGVRRAAR